MLLRLKSQMSATSWCKVVTSAPYLLLCPVYFSNDACRNFATMAPKGIMTFPNSLGGPDIIGGGPILAREPPVADHWFK